ncbi:C40 family peptidase [Paenibacillus sp. CC-CFT747]|nr:C40 family peptidase [Paenibacillus sp. CC-CFT747]
MLFAFSPSVFAATKYETKIERGVNFRSQPNLSSKVYRSLKVNEYVHVIHLEKPGWIKIQTKEGRTGYMSSLPKYSTFSMPSIATQRSNLVNYAKSLQDRVNYKYGARDEARLLFDCSSFTQYVYKKQGIYIPWGANAQTKYGTTIKYKSSLQMGDLVMMSFSKNSTRIGHVGIYIGGGKFIHNVNPTDDVVISDLNSGYWKDRFVKGTRVIR